MSKVIDLTDEAELDNIISSGFSVVVDFHQSVGCIPCKRIAPLMEKAAEQFTDITFIKVDVLEAEWAMEKFGIQGTPTLMQFDAGALVKRYSGLDSIHILKGLS